MLLSRLPLICAFVLLVVFAGSIYWQTAPILKTETSLPNLAKIQDTSSPRNTDSRTNHNIATFKLFGDTSLKKSQVVIKQKDLPKTKLKLILTGVLVSPSGEGAGALILGPDKQTQHYKINDELPGGATLNQVFADRVIVNRSGRLENLYFLESTSLGIERHLPYEEPEAQQHATQTTQNPKPASNNSNLTSARSQSIKNRLSKLKKRLLKNKQ